MVAARELRLDQVKLVADHAFNASLHRLRRVADPPKIEPRHQVQHDGAFGKMHPVQITHMLIGAPRRHQPAVAVALKQIQSFASQSAISCITALCARLTLGLLDPPDGRGNGAASCALAASKA